MGLVAKNLKRREKMNKIEITEEIILADLKLPELKKRYMEIGQEDLIEPKGEVEPDEIFQGVMDLLVQKLYALLNLYRDTYYEWILAETFWKIIGDMFGKSGFLLVVRKGFVIALAPKPEN